MATPQVTGWGLGLKVAVAVCLSKALDGHQCSAVAAQVDSQQFTATPFAHQSHCNL